MASIETGNILLLLQKIVWFLMTEQDSFKCFSTPIFRNNLTSYTLETTLLWK